MRADGGSHGYGLGADCCKVPGFPLPVMGQMGNHGGKWAQKLVGGGGVQAWEGLWGRLFLLDKVENVRAIIPGVCTGLPLCRFRALRSSPCHGLRLPCCRAVFQSPRVTHHPPQQLYSTVLEADQYLPHFCPCPPVSGQFRGGFPSFSHGTLQRTCWCGATWQHGAPHLTLISLLPVGH